MNNSNVCEMKTHKFIFILRLNNYEVQSMRLFYLYFMKLCYYCTYTMYDLCKDLFVYSYVFD